jgi:hypothetical protein
MNNYNFSILSLVVVFAFGSSHVSFAMESDESGDRLNRSFAGMSIEGEKSVKKGKGKSGKKRPDYSFEGNAEEAKNADGDVMKKYAEIERQLAKQLAEKEISNATYAESRFVLGALKTLNQHNKKICHEFMNKGKSQTYEFSKVEHGRPNPEVHYDASDVPFHLKAANASQTVFSAFDFAVEHSLVAEFFTDALSGGSGCLEARVNKVDTWHENKRKNFGRFEDFSPNRKIKALKTPIYQAISSYIQKNLSNFEDYINAGTPELAIAQIVDSFEGKVGIDGNEATQELARTILTEVFMSLSPTRIPVEQPVRAADSARPAKKRLSFDD